MKPLNELTVTEARDRLVDGSTTSIELTKACLDQIRSLDGAVHAFLEVYADDAIEQAEQSDQRRVDGRTLGPLDGIPIAIKDNLLYQGKKCTAGSRILENYIAVDNATVVQRLLDGGVVIVGRTNMDEFAMGSSTEHSAYGPTSHPRDPERVPGGSSGGSAAAVASNMCLAALGSDTGGSIRQPAAFCGTVGLKPTYGRVSRSGLIAMASSFDQVGPLTKSVADAALVLEAIHGRDPLDQTTADETVPEFRSLTDLKGMKVGLPRQAWGSTGLSAGVREHAEAAVEKLKSLGAQIKDIDLPYADEALAVYYVLMPCEVSANLSRFDGMRYGLRVPGLPLVETYAKSRALGFGAEARRRILLGSYALSHGYYDAYYVQAKKVQALIRRAYRQAFEDVDLIVTPTTPTTAFRRGEKIDDPLAMYLEDIFTVGVNVAGVPAVSVPCGDHEGLPVGLQFIGKWFTEGEMLSAASAFYG
jgi:aspartyl-tRNA(Asn)/glutamyl-tRNA(Gln) amidotransferase subunit A